MPIVVQVASPTASTNSSQGQDAGLMLESFIRNAGDFPPDPIIALTWLNDRYRQIWSATRWEFAQKSGVFSTVANVNSDSVDVTNGSTTVTEATSDAKWTSVIDERKFRRTGDNEYYDISNYSNDNPDTFLLSRVYEGTTGTDVGYEIFQDVYSLNTEVGVLHSIINLNQKSELVEISNREMEDAWAASPTIGTPGYYAPFGRDSNDIARIRLYPAPDELHGLLYNYTQEAPFIVSGSFLSSRATI